MNQSDIQETRLRHSTHSATVLHYVFAFGHLILMLPLALKFLFGGIVAILHISAEWAWEWCSGIVRPALALPFKLRIIGGTVCSWAGHTNGDRKTCERCR